MGHEAASPSFRVTRVDGKFHPEAQFQLQEGDGEMCTLTYFTLPEGDIDIRSTYTPTSMRGKGYAAILCDYACDYAERRGVNVIPSCSYVRFSYMPKRNAGQ